MHHNLDFYKAVLELKVIIHVLPSCKVYSVDWSCNRRLDQILSGSWDHSIKLVSIKPSN